MEVVAVGKEKKTAKRVSHFSRERLFLRFDELIIMVEGPGCKIKGEKIRGKLLKQKAITVAGNAVDRVSIVLLCTCWWSRALHTKYKIVDS